MKYALIFGIGMIAGVVALCVWTIRAMNREDCFQDGYEGYDDYYRG